MTNTQLKDYGYTFSDPRTAFDTAIDTGMLSDKQGAAQWAGSYMYMGDESGNHLFKHRITREYVRVAVKG